MKIHIIAPAMPPQLDGIGDYCALLAAELARQVEVTVLSGAGIDATSIAGVRIVSAFTAADPGSVHGIAACAHRDRPDWILLQYNPFSYGRLGLNLQLPGMLRRLRRELPQTRLAVMIHEPFVERSNWKFALMATWQRWQLRSLARTADVGFCSIDPWARQLRPWFAPQPLHHLPVGANIPRLEMPRAEARARLNIAPETFVIGLFGTAHASRLLGLVRETLEACRKTGRDCLVHYIGPNTAIVRAALGDLPLLAGGSLPAEEVSRRFAAMDISLAPFIDGISTRRGSLMAGLQHGVATVGTKGYLTDEMLALEDGRALLLADVSDPATFRAQALRLLEDAELRHRIGSAGQELYDREFDWQPIAARVLKAMR